MMPFRDKFVKTLEIALLILGLIISGYITVNALLFTGMNLIGTEKVNIASDRSSLLAVVILVILIVLASVFSEYLAAKDEAKFKSFKNAFVAAGVVLIFIICVLSVPFLDISISGDDAGIIASETYRMYYSHNFGSLVRGGYFTTCPHQAGSALLQMAFFHLSESHRVFFYMNIVLAISAVVAGALFIREIESATGTHFAEILWIFMSMGNVPAFLYIHYMYGEVAQYSCIIVCSYLLYMYVKKKKLIWALGCIPFIILGMALRMNTVILIISACIVLLFTAFKQKQEFIIIAIFIACAALTEPIAVRALYHGTGLTPEKGIPSSLYIAMGLQDDWKGAGWYNDYNRVVYDNVTDGDYEKSNEIGIREIKDRLRVITATPAEFRRFFREKLITQWVEPSYDSVYCVLHYSDSENAFIESLKDGSRIHLLWTYLNIYQSVVYLGFFIYILIILSERILHFKDSAASDFSEHILLISIIGAFLFSIIWEAKSRYCIEAFVSMIPLAVLGYSGIAVKIVKRLAISKKL